MIVSMMGSAYRFGEFIHLPMSPYRAAVFVSMDLLSRSLSSTMSMSTTQPHADFPVAWMRLTLLVLSLSRHGSTCCGG